MNTARWPEVARAIRKMIADGTLKPGDHIPTAVDLSARTGVSCATCRKAVLIMAANGELVPPVTRTSRPRVPGGPEDPAAPLSGALSAARRAAGLTQKELAGRAGMSADAVHHAETGRFRRPKAATWARFDQATGADGKLIKAHAAWEAAREARRAAGQEVSAVPPRRAGQPPARQEAAAALVRAMIEDGALKPGGAAPSGPELAGEAGCHRGTARKALLALAAGGTLTRGASPGARLRVAGAPPAGAAEARALAEALSAGLAQRRSRRGLNQKELAGLLGVSPTTIRHAETGRLWQSRKFWRDAGTVLRDDGALLVRYDEYKAAVTQPAPQEPAQAPGEPVPLASLAITPEGVLITWSDGTQTLARPPRRP